MELRCRVCHEKWSARGNKIPDRCNGPGRHEKKNIEIVEDPDAMDSRWTIAGLRVREGNEIVLDPETAAVLMANPASLEVFLRRVEAMGFRFAGSPKVRALALVPKPDPEKA